MAVLLAALQPEYFLSVQNITNVLKQIAMNALLAMGMFLVILTAGIDLSVGSVLALAHDVAGARRPGRLAVVDRRPDRARWSASAPASSTASASPFSACRTRSS